MTNEYGVRLDSNGYAPSVVEPFDTGMCFACGVGGDLARHEIFFGPNRAKSKALGCWVYLCKGCHDNVHNHVGSLDRQLKKIAQMRAMSHYGWSAADFRRRFGKSYVGE